MKKISSSHWIVMCSTALVFFAVSAFGYLSLHANSGFYGGNSVFVATEASMTEGVGTNVVTKSTSSTVTKTLDEIVEIEGTFQRTAALYSLLDKTSEKELSDLWHQSETIKRNSHRSSIQTMIVRKLATIDPLEALRWISETHKVRRAPLLKGLFHEWSLKDFGASIKGAKTLNGVDRRTALNTMLTTRADLSTSVLLDAAHELRLEDFALRSISTTQALQLLEKPDAAWDALVNDGVEDVNQLELFQLVASSCKEQEGLDVLLRAATLFPNKDDRAALSKVIVDVIGSELKEAFEYVRNLSKQERGELPSALAMAAARIDPEVALKEIATWSDDPIHVPLQRIASTTWARTDPRGMLNGLELLPQATRAQALEIAFTHLAWVSPTIAIDNLERANKFLSSEAMLPAIIAKQWSHTDPKAALEWSISYAGSNSRLREWLVMQLFQNLVGSDIDRAIEVSPEIRSTYLTVLPEAKYDVVMKLARSGKIDEAIAHLPLLNKNELNFALSDIGLVLVRAGEPYAAIELGANIPTPDPSVVVSGPVSYFKRIFSSWATRDPQQMFNSLQSLRSPLLRSLAARTLLDRQESRPTLSKASITDAETLLNSYPITKNLHLLELQLQDEEGVIDLDQMVLPPELKE